LQSSRTVKERKVIGLVFALSKEMSPLQAQFKGLGRLEEEGTLFHPGSMEGSPVVLSIAGIGPERAKRATKRLLELFRIKTVMSLGYAGALREGIKTGELVIARNVLTGYWEKGAGGLTSYPCPPLLMRLCQKVVEENGIKVHVGDVLTVEGPIKRPEAKRQAGLLTGAVAVDMESAGVAVAAREAQVPFIALKVILDEVDEELRGTELADGEGRVSLLKTFTFLFYHPWDIMYFIRLNRQAEQSARELTRFLPALAREVNKGHILEG
jgi:adenosylhomocysteine nucleosidase